MQQIIFEFTTKHGTFRDALWLDENHTYTSEELDAMKLERLNNWWAFVAPDQTLEILPTPSE
jgi:hypothetical protein